MRSTYSNVRYSDSAGIVVLIFACVAVAACGRTDDSTHGPFPVTQHVGDEGWLALISTLDSPSLPSDIAPSSLADFLRDGKQQRVNFRVRGLQYWHAYPEDPKRYSWLILTVHLPPTVASPDSDDDVPISSNLLWRKSRQSEWQSIYPSLRDEFWQSEVVSDEARRFLWYGELEQLLLQHREASKRGETVANASQSSNVLAFLRSYPSPFEASHKYEWLVHSDMCNRLLRLVLEGGLIWSEWSDRELLQFFLDVGKTNNRVAIAALEELREIYKTGGREALREFNSAPSSSSWAELPTVANASPLLPESEALQAYNRWFDARAYRDSGVNRILGGEYTLEDAVRWLKNTLRTPPAYAQNLLGAAIETRLNDSDSYLVDTDAKANGQQTLQAVRQLIWQDPELSDQIKVDIRTIELQRDYRNLLAEVEGSRNREFRPNVAEFMRELMALHNDFADAQLNTSFFLSEILSTGSRLGIGNDTSSEFFDELTVHPNFEVREVALQAMDYLDLRLTPFELELPTSSGENFDIAGLRGKIVLLDHWETTCGPCIAAKPMIRDVYHQYKARGFEVVAIAYDGRRNEKTVRRIKTELGLNWVSLVGDGRFDDFVGRFGLRGFPQYFLLDRDGTLYAGSGEVDQGRNLEALLDEMLAAEAAEKEASTVH